MFCRGRWLQFNTLCIVRTKRKKHFKNMIIIQGHSTVRMMHSRRSNSRVIFHFSSRLYDNIFLFLMRVRIKIAFNKPVKRVTCSCERLLLFWSIILFMKCEHEIVINYEFVQCPRVFHENGNRWCGWMAHTQRETQTHRPIDSTRWNLLTPLILNH